MPCHQPFSRIAAGTARPLSRQSCRASFDDIAIRWPAVAASYLALLTAQLPLTLDMPDPNGNEKHVKLPKARPTGATRPGTIRHGEAPCHRSACSRQEMSTWLVNRPSQWAH